MKTVLLIMAILVCFTAPLWAANEKAQEHAAQQALEKAPYQSALRDRYDLPGLRIMPWVGEQTINVSDPCFFQISWVEPVGPIRGTDPYGENGAGRVTMSALIDGTEVRLHTSGCVEYFEQYGTEMVVRKYWYEFPAYSFEPGQYSTVIISEVPKLGYFDVYSGLLNVEGE